MSVQSVIVLFLFAVAVFYIGRMVYKSLTAKKGCGAGCKCSVDFSRIDNKKA